MVVQRVARAAVRRIDADPVQEERIDRGLLLLAGFRVSDDDAVLCWMADKCTCLRIFADASGAMNRSVAETGGVVLVVPNFTLYGDVRKGRRPSFADAAPPELAAVRFDQFVSLLRRGSCPVRAGFFQTSMHVESINDGPVTLWMEREAALAPGSD